MVNIPTKINETLKNYLSLLNKKEIPIKEAILFGSYANGNFNELSDIDIALVSDVFFGDRISDKDKIRELTLSVSSMIDVIPFSPKDFNSKDPFVKEILKTGLRLV